MADGCSICRSLLSDFHVVVRGSVKLTQHYAKQ